MANRLQVDHASIADIDVAQQIEFVGEIDGEEYGLAVKCAVLKELSGGESESYAIEVFERFSEETLEVCADVVAKHPAGTVVVVASALEDAAPRGAHRCPQVAAERLLTFQPALPSNRCAAECSLLASAGGTAPCRWFRIDFFRQKLSEMGASLVPALGRCVKESKVAESRADPHGTTHLMRMMALFAFAALAACGSNEETTKIGGTTYTSSKNGETATIDGAKGKVSVAQGASAANTTMPTFAPQYPGSTITSRMESEREGRARLIVTQTTSAAVSEVADFYRASLAKAGFTVDKGTSMDAGAMFSGEGAEGKVSVTVSRDEQSTSAVVSITRR